MPGHVISSSDSGGSATVPARLQRRSGYSMGTSICLTHLRCEHLSSTMVLVVSFHTLSSSSQSLAGGKALQPFADWAEPGGYVNTSTRQPSTTNKAVIRPLSHGIACPALLLAGQAARTFDRGPASAALQLSLAQLASCTSHLHKPPARLPTGFAQPADELQDLQSEHADQAAV